MSRIPTYVEHPDAYARATQERIKANARLTRGRKFDAAYPGLRQRIEGWLVDENGELVQREYGDGSIGRVADPNRVRFPRWMQDALDEWGGLTDAQAAVARKYIEKHDARTAQREIERANAAKWATPGRQVVEGVLLKTRIERFDVGRWGGSTSLKALVKMDDGRLLWTSLPRKLWDALSEALGWNIDSYLGCRVSFTVAVEPKADDPTFAFGRRPTGGEYIRKEEE